MLPISKDAYRLLHEGTLAFTDIEQNGLCIDIEYCKRQDLLLEKKINKLSKQIDQSEEAKLYRKKTGQKFNPSSHTQLKTLLFDFLGLETDERTVSGEMSTRDSVLERIDNPFVNYITEMKRLGKAKNTYIKNLLSETVNGILHPFFNLHNVVTFRSSSDHINFQNIPKRNEEIQKLIRTAIVPPKDFLIMEPDYSQIEVRIAACYHQDPRMLKYLFDSSKDMHRDTAVELFRLENQKQCSNEIRQCAKNKFVFPQFYGDYYISCAKNLWQYMISNKLKTSSGTLLIDHLKLSGIENIEEFTDHVQIVENRFWNKRFKVYTKWKKDWFSQYLQKTYFDTLTGFRCQGLMNRNDVINYPVQGSAFHCLLWSLIQTNKELKKKKMKSYICGQIHDSMVLYVHKSEYETVISILHDIMEERIKKKYKWINVPIPIEIECSPLNKSWYEKEEIVNKKCPVCGKAWAYKKREGCPLCQL